MYSKGSAFVILLIALALVGGAVAVSNNSQFTILNSEDGLAAVAVSARDKNTLVDIERQLTSAQRTGNISPSSYRSLESKLKALEKKKIDTRKARTLLKKLEVGGTQKKSEKNTTPPPRGLGTSPQLRGGGKTIVVPTGPVTWDYYPDEDVWRPSRPPPPCGALLFNSPVDLSKVEAILYPGQIRGRSIADYKAHGGFILKESSEVRIPFDAYVLQGARFLQNGTLQYGFDIVSECGIMMRFGHLSKLTPKFQALAEKMRPAVEMDSHTTDLRPYAVRVSKGELLATKVGTPEQTGTDWGLVDIRQLNKSAKNLAYRMAHKFQGRYDNYALCWLDYLPVDEQRIVKTLPAGDGRMGKMSDYCKSGNSIVTPKSPLVREKVVPLVAEKGGQEQGETNTAFAAIKDEVEEAERKGGRFSREHYERVERDLARAEQSGVNASDIARLRSILQSLTPHLADEARAKEEAAKVAAANAPCTDPPPVLTADFTDFSKIAKITAPGSPSFEGPKGHSFIWTGDARVPLYAPAAGIYDSGSYSKDDPSGPAQYLLFFKVKESCGWQFKFDHVLEPLDTIKAQLPSEPKIADSRGTSATNPIEFKAGDLIGYTSRSNIGGNWDFGLYNMNEQGALKAHNCYGMHCHSVCWPDFYATGKKEAYRKLLEGPKLVCAF